MTFSLNQCAVCGEQLALDDFDGLCTAHDTGWPPRDARGRFRPLDAVERRYVERCRAKDGAPHGQ